MNLVAASTVNDALPDTMGRAAVASWELGSELAARLPACHPLAACIKLTRFRQTSQSAPS